MNGFHEVRCLIKAINAQGKLIPNGGSAAVSAQGGATIEFWAVNDSPLSPEKFMWKGVVYRNGQKVQPELPAAWITMKPNETRKVGTQQVPFAYPSSKIEARMLVDIGDFIDELSEANNKVTLTFTGSVIG